MNLREFWAAEAAKLRDTSEILGVNTNAMFGDSNNISVGKIFKDNVIIILLGSSGEGANTLRLQSNMHRYKAWNLLLYKTLQEVANNLNVYFGIGGRLQDAVKEPIADKSIKTLVIETHGGIVPSTKEPAILFDDTKVGNTSVSDYITLTNLQNRKDTKKNIVISKLKQILDKVADNGTVVFSGCNLGYGDKGDAMLTELARLSDYRLKIYLHKTQSSSFINYSSYNDDRSVKISESEYTNLETDSNTNNWIWIDKKIKQINKKSIWISDNVNFHITIQ